MTETGGGLTTPKAETRSHVILMTDSKTTHHLKPKTEPEAFSH